MRSANTATTGKTAQEAIQKNHTYIDTIYINGPYHHLATVTIDIHRRPLAIRHKLKYRDAARRRRNNLKKKLQARGQIFAMRDKWNNRKIQHETKTDKSSRKRRHATNMAIPHKPASVRKKSKDRYQY